MKYTITNKDTGRLLQVDSKEKLDEIIFATRHLTGINIDVQSNYEISKDEKNSTELGEVPHEEEKGSILQKNLLITFYLEEI